MPKFASFNLHRISNISICKSSSKMSCICARVNGFRFHKKITLLYTTYLSANYHPNRSMDFSMKSLANFFWVCMFNPHFMLWKFGCFWHWFNEKCIAEFLQVTVKNSICRGKIRKGKMKSLKDFTFENSIQKARQE